MTDGYYINTAYQNDEIELEKQGPKTDEATPKAVLTDSLPDEPNNNSNQKRATWGKSIEFLMSCIAMNVGLGNIWRFPFVAYENGGGAFLIPYLIVLVLIGRPMYYLEMCLGQFNSRGNVKIFENLAPVLKGEWAGQSY
ncbi:unnamed protein product [Acanthoscelides obtectus]|uniref:Transporter n=1 Tax=Acanthoscelides obtectus TaxID=200917 RepID=A0A9P0VTY1_ACAOB|nr:unnamed protein product [Acanthoscelides obtectus]CAK1682781.1 Sodium-dependent nutrient amino acid transporter 1 [Acanthoscelides obtectus]